MNFFLLSYAVPFLCKYKQSHLENRFSFEYNSIQEFWNSEMNGLRCICKFNSMRQVKHLNLH